MNHPVKLYLLLMLVVVMAPIRQLSAADVEPVSDVRVLIDISGSMKKNDPHNLRAPALRLIVGLLPTDAQSGVWTFGKYTNMLVPLKKVNSAWKIDANKQSKKIHSHGLFTNIELALNKATANLKKDSPRFRRSVILLSDGLVDIDKSKKINQQSRQRILDIIVPRLKKANVAVHTIALSSTADHELLKAISVATDGWYEQADSAEQLQRVFLHLIEKSAKRDSVPLVKNGFKVDTSVSEMTLLVFRRQDTKAAELLLPDQSRLSYKDKLENVHWHNEANYDLITIENPMNGQWQIDADVDPDNRVMIVTDMKLKSTDLPNNILIGESFDFNASLTNKGKTIRRQDFLKLVNATLIEESDSNNRIVTTLNKEQKDGIYNTNIGDNLKAGRNDVIITFISDTFERERRQSINVVEMPFEIISEQLRDRPVRTHRITLIPDLDFIKNEPLNIAALLTGSDGSEWSYDIMMNQDKKWQITLADLKANEVYTLALQIRGETVKGRSLFLQPDIIMLKDESDSDVETAVEIAEDVIDDEVELEQKREDELATEPELDEEPIIDEMAGDLDGLLPGEDDDELMLENTDSANEDQVKMAPATKLAIGNGVILLFVIIAILVWRRKQAANKNPGDLL